MTPPPKKQSPVAGRSRGRRSRRKTGWEDAFLDTLWRTGRKGLAARTAGVTLRTVERRQRIDPTFSRHVATAVADAKIDRLLERARQRPTLRTTLAALAALRPDHYPG